MHRGSRREAHLSAQFPSSSSPHQIGVKTKRPSALNPQTGFPGMSYWNPECTASVNYGHGVRPCGCPGGVSTCSVKGQRVNVQALWDSASLSPTPTPPSQRESSHRQDGNRRARLHSNKTLFTNHTAGRFDPPCLPSLLRGTKNRHICGG